MHDWTARVSGCFGTRCGACRSPQERRQSRQIHPVRRHRTQAAPTSVAPNDKIVLGFIGVGGMGTGLINTLHKFPDVKIAAVCDVYDPTCAARSRRQAERRKPSTIFVVCWTARISTRS